MECALGVAGVFYCDKGGVSWMASWRRADGKSSSKSFAVKRYGFEEARQLAEAARREAEALGLVGGGGPRRTRQKRKNASNASDTDSE
jgi:hypothetical protein